MERTTTSDNKGYVANLKEAMQKIDRQNFDQRLGINGCDSSQLNSLQYTLKRVEPKWFFHTLLF